MLTLKDIDFKVKHGELVCVIGDVGSGKSSLLNTIIGDMLYVSKDCMDKYDNGTQFNTQDELDNFQKDIVEGL